MPRKQVGKTHLGGGGGFYGSGFWVVVAEDYMNIYVTVEPEYGAANWIFLEVQRKIDGSWRSVENKLVYVEGEHIDGVPVDKFGPKHVTFKNYAYKGTPIRVVAESYDEPGTVPYDAAYVTWTR